MLEILIARAWYYNIPVSYKKKLFDLVNYYGVKGLVNGDDRDKLLKLISSITRHSIASKVGLSVQQLFDELETKTLREWTNELYQSR